MTLEMPVFTAEQVSSLQIMIDSAIGTAMKELKRSFTLPSPPPQQATEIFITEHSRQVQQRREKKRIQRQKQRQRRIILRA